MPCLPVNGLDAIFQNDGMVVKSSIASLEATHTWTEI